MSVTAEIETRYRTNVLTVPIQSVTTRLPKGAVDEKQKKTAKKDEDEDMPEKKPARRSRMKPTSRWRSCLSPVVTRSR